MIIGVMSDSHGNIENLKKAAEALTKMGAKYLIHLGDDYDDVSKVQPTSVEWIRIPGVFSDYYKDPNIVNRPVKRFENIDFLLSHTPSKHENDLPADPDPVEMTASGKVRGVFHGHTHIPRIELVGKTIWLNPGHLKDEDKKGYPPSFAAIAIEAGRISARIMELISGKELMAGVLNLK